METATNPTQPPAAVSALPDVLRFMQVLWAVSHGLETTSKRMTTAIGITGPQRLVLRVVGLFPGLSAGDLATILHLTAPGSQSNGRLIGTVEAAIAQALSGISDADRIATQRVLGRLTDHLQRPAAPAAQSPEPRLAPARRGRRPTT